MSRVTGIATSVTKRGNENKAAHHHLIMQNDKCGRELLSAEAVEEASHHQVLRKRNEEVELQLQLQKPVDTETRIMWIMSAQRSQNLFCFYLLCTQVPG